MGDPVASSGGANPSEVNEYRKVNKYWWHVNKGGFPIPEDTWERMWTYVVATHPEGIEIVLNIRGKQHRRLAAPQVPVINVTDPISDSLWKLQQYLQSLQYNHTGTQFFDIKKNKSLSRLMDNAREMISECLPIKCLEAVVLSLYLTSSLLQANRFCISFKTRFKGQIYRHVVLGLHHKAVYGALGMSRREDLMYKPLIYITLADLIFDFITSYHKYVYMLDDHVVEKIKLSSYISHDVSCGDIIKWKYISFNLREVSDQDLKKSLDQASRTLRSSL